MTQSTKSSDDPLDGYRGRPEFDSEEQLESEIRSIHEGMDNEVDLAAMREVIRMDDLIRELNNESSTMRRLVDYVTKKMDDCSQAWQCESDPTSSAALNAHRDIRAARLVLDWVQMTVEHGTQAERQLEVEEHG